jgi:hypothetical protein
MPQPNKEILDQIQAAKDMQQMYKNVFGTIEGRIVLGDILTTAHFGDPLNPLDPVAVAEHNAAVLIARQAGAFDKLWIDLGMVKE